MQENKKTTLRSWMWRAFVQSALIPLILVETVLIAAYLLTNSSIRDAQIEHLRQTALTDLKSAAQQEAKFVSERLKSITQLTQTYGEQVQSVLLRDAYLVDDLERQRHARTNDGVLFTRSDDNRAASFYANSTPKEKQDLDKVMRLAQLDPLMKTIKTSNKLVSAVYFNSWDSYNRLYPWFYTPDQYPHDMVIPNYNFYYLADASHNPQRKVVWTDIYVDPAGQGWMMSALAPVYRGDFLEGVAGLDVTVDNILKEIVELQVPWSGYAMLVSGDLNIMALPPAGERDFALSELTKHTYDEAIRKEIFKPADFNLGKRTDTQALAQAVSQSPSGIEAINLAGKAQLAAWATIPETGWKLITVVDEAAVFSQTNALASRYQQIGYLLIAGLVLFYLLFFAVMWVRSRQLSQRLQQPIDHIGEMMQQIGQGNWFPARAQSRILELDCMAETTRAMGAQLADSEAVRLQAQNRLELVLDSTTESIWEIDLERRRIHIQGRFIERFGLKSGELELNDFYARIHPEDREAVIACHEHPEQRPNNDYTIEYRFSDACGLHHWLLSRARVVAQDMDSGHIQRIAGTHVDIDALKATEEALVLASQQAQAANIAKTRFLSSMSHELRTPLNAVQGFAQIIQLELSEHPSESHFKQYTDEILAASNHLCLLVDDILDLARIEAEKTELSLETVDARRIMSECIELIRPQTSEHGLHLEGHLPEGALLVQAEPRRLRQILLNLLSNAIKYNRPHGHISLSYKITPDSLRLIVEDTGYGISEEKQALLFKPFQRLGHENSNIKGTGIGLVLSRELAEMMNGRIDFNSDPDIGSTFWIELPFSPELQKRPRQQAPASSNLLRTLYVEDNRSSQVLVQKALADLADVDILDNGLEALHWITENPPELLLLDIDLPGLQGDSLLRSLRKNARTRDLPVIVISAGALPEDFALVSDLNVDCYLTKPLKIQALREAVLQLSTAEHSTR